MTPVTMERFEDIIEAFSVGERSRTLTIKAGNHVYTYDDMTDIILDDADDADKVTFTVDPARNGDSSVDITVTAVVDVITNPDETVVHCKTKDDGIVEFRFFNLTNVNPFLYF